MTVAVQLGTGSAGMAPSSLAPAHTRRLLAAMVLMRRFEERTAECYTEGEIRGFLHRGVGQEATAAGGLATPEPEDRVVAACRLFFCENNLDAMGTALERHRSLPEVDLRRGLDLHSIDFSGS